MISRFLAEYLIDAEIIREDDKAIIQYGIYGLISTTINMATILTIGVCCNCILESVLFAVAFYFLRIHAGGYHARTPLQCYFCSVMIAFLNFGIIYKLALGFGILTLIFIVASIIIFLTAPIDSINKPMDALERNVYRKKTRVIISALVVLYFAFFFLKTYLVCWSISMACVNVSALLVLGGVGKSIVEKHKKEKIYEN